MLAALLVDGSPDEMKAVRGDLRAHSRSFRAAIEENRRRVPRRSLKASLGELRAPLEAYIASAEQLVSLAGQDRAAAAARLPAFSARFTALEGAMEAVSEKIERYNAAEARRADAQAYLGRITTIGCLVLSMAFFVGLVFAAGAGAEQLKEMNQGWTRSPRRHRPKWTIHGRSDEIGRMACAGNFRRSAGKASLETAEAQTTAADGADAKDGPDRRLESR